MTRRIPVLGPKPKQPEGIAAAVALALEHDRERVRHNNEQAVLARIVPPAADASGLTRVQGTKVYLGDGRELPGVASVVLIAEPGNVWQAVIRCYVQPPAVSTLAAVTMEGASVPRWKAAIVRWLGLRFEPQPPL